ncbi:hypothetical protein [Alteromonas stellipolaris]|jgi:hypothetical protein|uniref:hypothetical protein n=1 Tax=Alteromonas stellipolaris TaxID=233316 RepID=UPI001D405020|nr:hypothetical protein [Alteromonas stellipolaris]MBZ2162962.1 hypothetical protein [Alteromonas stellipolaris]
MEESIQLEIDGVKVKPVAMRFYEELVDIELNNSDSNRIFPEKSVPRYSFRQNEVSLGYFKVTRAKALANEKTTVFTLHRQ